MITTTYDFSSGSGYVYDINKIGFVSSMAELLLTNNTGQTFTPTLSSSTYNASLITYLGGALEQKDQRPATATFYAAWTSQLNANWSGPGNGSLTVTPENGAAFNNTTNLLDLTGSTNKYVTFSATSNADSLQTISIEIQIIPNYSGAPPDDQVFFNISSNSGNSEDNVISIDNFTDGRVYVEVYDQDGNNPVELFTGFNPTAGQTYTFLVQIDGTSGTSTMYLNGSQVSQVTGTTFTRSGSVPFGYIGKYNEGFSVNSNFSVANLSVYSTIVTPASAVLSPTIYATATATLPEFTYAGLGALQAFSGFSATDANAPHYTLNAQYWNGSAWVSSNGTYAQANTAATISTNISALAASSTLQIDAIFQSANSPQMSVSAVNVTYTGQIYPTSNPMIAPNAALTMDGLSNFTDVHSASGSDGVQYYLLIGSTPYWWNGAAWAVSNASYSQSNPASVIATNASTFPISSGGYVTPVALLSSATGATTPSLTSLTLMYDFFGPEPTPPNTCAVFGYILDENEVPINGATVSVTNNSTFINNGVVIAQGVRTVKTDSTGYFSMDLVETATMLVPALLVFAVTYTQTQVGTGFTPTTFTFGATIIPNTPEANIASLTFQ